MSIQTTGQSQPPVTHGTPRCLANQSIANSNPACGHTIDAASGVNLLAFNAIPMGHEQTQLMLFPEDANTLAHLAEDEGLVLDGPQYALLIRGDDELGALAGIHHELADAKVNVSASSGVTDGEGGFGYVVYVAPEDFSEATAALGV